MTILKLIRLCMEGTGWVFWFFFLCFIAFAACLIVADKLHRRRLDRIAAAIESQPVLDRFAAHGTHAPVVQMREAPHYHDGKPYDVRVGITAYTSRDTFTIDDFRK